MQMHRQGVVARPALSKCGRRDLIASTAGCSLFGLAPGANADEQGDVELYFGVGSFQHLQHVFTYKEALKLDRRDADLSPITGYAGGANAGYKDRVCMNPFEDNYQKLGHTQVVNLFIPKDLVVEFATLFFDEVAKRPQDQRSNEYRPAIGFRKGMKSTLFPLIQIANAERFKLVKGEGDDVDKLDEGVVYIYNARDFPFRPAEVANQFKNDPREPNYDFDYGQLSERMVKLGKIYSTGCPSF